jgi:mono/diheme cytochrome c family protein
MYSYFQGSDIVTARSYLSSVTWSPDQTMIAAPMEASDVVMIMNVPEWNRTSYKRGSFRNGHALKLAEVGEGPIEVIWTHPDEARVLHSLDHSLTELGFELLGPRHVFDSVRGSLHLFEGDLGTEIELGRRLFTDAMDTRIASPTVGVSCSTCHFDGRTDGLTWEFDFGDRQTPSLAGLVSETAPVTWTDEVASVAEEAEITSGTRMGGATGDDIDPALYEAIAAYIDTTRDEINAEQDPDAVARGQEVFFQEDTACATCHIPPLYTDNKAHDTYDFEGVMTPSLVGVSATPPYLHDGTAPGLAAVLERSLDGGMGDTSGLDDQQMADLETFLRSL